MKAWKKARPYAVATAGMICIMIVCSDGPLFPWVNIGVIALLALGVHFLSGKGAV